MNRRFFLKLLVMVGLSGGWELALGQGLVTGNRPYPPVHRHPPVRRSRNDATRPPLATAPVVVLSGPAFCPLVELRALNLAYVRELTYRRRLRGARPVGQFPVRFDSLLLPSTVLHNQRLVGVAEKIFHDLQQPHAELCGFSGDMQQFRNQPDQLAHYIWRLFDESKKGHKEIQQNHRYAFVSVSCSAEHFVVRLDYYPTAPAPLELDGYGQWRAQSIDNCGAVSLAK